jgi:PIN domain nuclease of toxin-antitoxin system
MILLLDAHVLLWWLADDPTLARDAYDAIASPSSDVIVSAATVWEIAIKREIGKLDAPRDLRMSLEASGLTGLPVTLEDAEGAARLPRHHADPFDRMVIAQARRLGAVIVTRDRAFAAYDVDVLPA